MSSPGQFSPKRAKPVAALCFVLTDSPPPVAAFRAAVRGELPVKGLPGGAAAEGCNGTQRLRAADVAEGIINLKSDPAALSEWANFILAASDATKIQGAESDYWDRLLSGIWEIALGTRPKDPVIALAYAIRARQSLA